MVVQQCNPIVELIFRIHIRNASVCNESIERLLTSIEDRSLITNPERLDTNNLFTLSTWILKDEQVWRKHREVAHLKSDVNKCFVSSRRVNYLCFILNQLNISSSHRLIHELTFHIMSSPFPSCCTCSVHTQNKNILLCISIYCIGTT